MYDSIAYLLKEKESFDEYGNTIAKTEETEVYVEEKSIGMREFYHAAVADLKPNLTLVLADVDDYDNQKLIRYDDVIYSVLRHYRNGHTLELVLQERLANG